MKKYQYQLIQYVHDHFTGEFVNMGIVVYAPGDAYLNCKLVKRHTRIKALFPQVNGRFIDSVLKSIEVNIKRKANELKELFRPDEQLNKITAAIISEDNSAIRFTPVKLGLDIDPDAALHDLFGQLVEKYMPEVSKSKSLSDYDVWQKKYREYFEKFNITNKLVKHTLQTNNDEFQFEKAWKNDIWHCYQPISFALQDKESVKDKVYRWSGKLKELQSAKEELHLTFLTAGTKNHKDLESFIKEYLTFDANTLKTEIIKENQAKEFAQAVKELMDAHRSV